MRSEGSSASNNVRAFGSNPNSHTFKSIGDLSGNSSASRQTGGFGTIIQPIKTLTGIEEQIKETEREDSFHSGEISRENSVISTNRKD